MRPSALETTFALRAALIMVLGCTSTHAAAPPSTQGQQVDVTRTPPSYLRPFGLELGKPLDFGAGEWTKLDIGPFYATCNLRNDNPHFNCFQVTVDEQGNVAGVAAWSANEWAATHNGHLGPSPSSARKGKTKVLDCGDARRFYNALYARYRAEDNTFAPHGGAYIEFTSNEGVAGYQQFRGGHGEGSMTDGKYRVAISFSCTTYTEPPVWTLGYKVGSAPSIPRKPDPDVVLSGI